MPPLRAKGVPLGFMLLFIALLLSCLQVPRISDVRFSFAAFQEKRVPEPKAAQELGPGLKEDARKAYQNGLQLEKNKQYLDAVAAFREAIDIDPQFADAYGHLGLVQIELKNYLEAIGAFKRQLASTPPEPQKQAAIHANLGYAYERSKDLDQAIEEYKKVIELTPNNADAFATLAAAYGEKGLTAEAVNAYQKSLELRPNDKETLRTFGALCRDNNLFVESTHIYEQLYSFDKNDAEAIRSLAWLYLKIESYPKAIEMYRKLLAMEPENMGERLNLAIAYEKNSQPDSAIVQYEKVLHAQPENSQLYCNIAFLYSDAKKPAQAIENAKKGLEQKPSDACLNCAWGRALEGLSDYQGAIEKFELAVNDAQWGDYAKKQIERQQKLIQRKEALKEKEELGY